MLDGVGKKSNYCGVTLLVGDSRTREVKHWTEWLTRIADIRRAFARWHPEFDPFHFNEAASVAVLSNAAAQAGFLALTEYVVDKRHSTRGRPFRLGRCDLWIADVESDCCWAFEFKQHFSASKPWESTFDRHMEHAYYDARDLDNYEGDKRVGGLILVPKDPEKLNPDIIHYYDELCRRSDLSFRLGKGKCSVWLAFRFANR